MGEAQLAVAGALAHPDFLSAALAYAERGWHVAPLRPGTKRPLTEHGFKDATIDPAKIRTLWGRHPGANILIATEASRLVVVDADVKHPPTNGYDSLKRIVGSVPGDTLVVETASGGGQLYYAPNGSAIASGAGFAPGIDIRGLGGYVVAPPSVIDERSGQPANEHGSYQFVTDLPVIGAPEWLLTLAAGKSSANGNGAKFEPAAEDAVLVDGAGRNDYLMRYSRRECTRHTASQVMTLVRAENERVCRPPVTDRELQDTIFKSVPRLAQTQAAGVVLKTEPEAPADDGSVLASDVTTAKVQWLWRKWIPLGKITIFDGNPDVGKSTVMTDIMARLSRGDIMPDGSPGIDAAGSVYWTVEDDADDTIVPRLIAAGADLTRIRIRRCKRDAKGEVTMDIADIETLRRDIDGVGAKLVFIDPITAHLPGDVHSHIDAEFRNAMTPMQRFVADQGVALVASRHLNKTVGGDAITRGGGTMGIIGLARSGLIAGHENGDDPDMRIVVPLKHNLAKASSALRYKMVSADEDSMPAVTWHGISYKSAEDLVAPRAPIKVLPALDKAIAFLHRKLDGMTPSGLSMRDLVSEAREEDISEITLRRAKKDLHIQSVKRDTASGWFWTFDSAARQGDHPEDTDDAA